MSSSDEEQTELPEFPPAPDSLVPEDQLQDYLNNIPDGGPIMDEVLGRTAKTVIKKAEDTSTVIDDLREHLSSTPVHGRIRNFTVPPTYKEVFAGAHVKDESGWFVQSVDAFKAAVARYQTGQFDPSVVDQDILRMQAQLIFFSAYVNHMESIAVDAESTAKQAESNAFLEAKGWLDDQGFAPRAVSLDLLSAVAKEATADRTSYATTAKTVANTVKGFYYALKDFIAYLDRASQRAQNERHAMMKRN